MAAASNKIGFGVLVKTWLSILLLLPSALLAQDDLWDDEDWGDEEWGDEEQSTVWSGFVEAGLGTRFQSDPLISNDNTLQEVRCGVLSD